ncbi:MAG: hypothetical protein HYX81_03730 [Chloroflexi bacterium]|nr:hypothetical protein [Chloroflexota bacterium]
MPNKKKSRVQREKSIVTGIMEPSGEEPRLEDTQRAVLNILEDFNTEKTNLELAQKAALNILDDFDMEKTRLEDTQRAVLNILEDFNAEKIRLEDVHRAGLNILEDFDTEKSNLEMTQKAALNILDDFNAEKTRLEDAQRAALNILEDFNTEKTNLELAQKATFNILEDFNAEKARLQEDQRAFLNILDDLNKSNEELQKARDILEVRVAERTAALQQSNVQLLAEIEVRRKTEETLRQRTVELETANKELESFSYSVSHDLRAPLRSMDGYSKALIEDYASKLDEQGRQWLANIRGSSQLMARLINDILGLSRVVRAELKLERVNLSDMARSIAERLKAAEPQRQVEFNIMPGMEDMADANLIALALENLLGNAFKFTSRRPLARIEFATGQEGDRKFYFVRDNGAGFDMKYATDLFQPFHRLHSEKEYPGTGIGLVTVKRIIDRHGGEIWAEAETDKGATFYFTIGHRLSGG